MAQRSIWRLGILTLGLAIVVLSSVAAGVALSPVVRHRFAPPPPPVLKEAEFLWTAYGPDRNSQFYEEWIIRDFFGDKRGGFFVDVGANDYRKFNNTYYLEKELGWEGVAVEPLVQFAADYATHRPRTKFRPFFVSDVSDAFATMYTTENSLVSSGQKDFTQRWGKSADTSPLKVPTITLTDLLDREGVATFDFMSMDIESWEPKALAGFDIKRFRPDLVCIEGHAEVLQQILDYFQQHGYVIVGKYLRADVKNLYFAPESSLGQRVTQSAGPW